MISEVAALLLLWPLGRESNRTSSSSGGCATSRAFCGAKSWAHLVCISTAGAAARWASCINIVSEWLLTSSAGPDVLGCLTADFWCYWKLEELTNFGYLGLDLLLLLALGFNLILLLQDRELQRRFKLLSGQLLLALLMNGKRIPQFITFEFLSGPLDFGWDKLLLLFWFLYHELLYLFLKLNILLICWKDAALIGTTPVLLSAWLLWRHTRIHSVLLQLALLVSSLTLGVLRGGKGSIWSFGWACASIYHFRMLHWSCFVATTRLVPLLTFLLILSSLWVFILHFLSVCRFLELYLLRHLRLMGLLLLELTIVAGQGRTGNRKRVHAWLSSLLLLELSFSLPFFLKLFDFGVQYLILVDHISELIFQLLILHDQLLVLSDTNTTILKLLRCRVGIVTTCLAFSSLLKLVLQFLVVCSKPIDDVLLLLIDLSELLVFLIVLL